MARARRKAAKVHRLFGLEPPHTGRVVPEIVDFLSELLAEAKRGEITALAVAKVDGGGIPQTAWHGGVADRNLLVASATYLQHRLVESRTEI